MISKVKAPFTKKMNRKMRIIVVNDAQKQHRENIIFTQILFKTNYEYLLSLKRAVKKQAISFQQSAKEL